MHLAMGDVLWCCLLAANSACRSSKTKQNQESGRPPAASSKLWTLWLPVNRLSWWHLIPTGGWTGGH